VQKSPNSPTHLDPRGRARMVDLAGKEPTERVARAQARVQLTEAVRALLLAGDLPKGEGLGVARLAGIQAAKETSRLIPLCHQVPLSSVWVEFHQEGEDSIRIVGEARCLDRTGVEMEALTAVSIAALTLYDMCKAMHRGIRITGIELLHKSGGRSGTWDRGDPHR
jgi:cyclic pyranopterin phosphate synthase